MPSKTKKPSNNFLACYPPPEQPKTEAADTRRPGKGVRGRPWTNLQALAQEHSMDALQKVIELMSDSNPCVRFGASRLVLKLRNEKPSKSHGRAGIAGESTVDDLKVTIRRFKEEDKSGSAKRHRKLPVVQRGRKGPRDPGDGDGTGMPALRGQRTGVCDEPGVGHGPATGVQGAGAKGRA